MWFERRNNAIAECIPRLRRYARALVGERNAADDLVQDTLERAWAKWALFRREADLRAWLFAIMHNVFVDQQRRRGRIVEQGGEDMLETIAGEQSPLDPLELRDLVRGLERLPAVQREVLLLVALEDMAYADVAYALKIPLGTVMSRLSRARQNLQRYLDGEAAPQAVSLKVVK